MGTLDNISVVSNNGSGLFAEGGAELYIRESIFHNNNSQILLGTYNGGATLDISYSNVMGGLDSINTSENLVVTWGSGNIDVDPMFVDTANGDYTLQMDSPLIDAGHPDSTDADGTIADIGAYYYDQSGQPARVQGFVTTPTDSNEIYLTWELSLIHI